MSTIKELFSILEESGGAFLKIAVGTSPKDGKVTKLIICVDGEVECGEILAAIKPVEDSWDE